MRKIEESLLSLKLRKSMSYGDDLKPKQRLDGEAQSIE